MSWRWKLVWTAVTKSPLVMKRPEVPWERTADQVSPETAPSEWLRWMAGWFDLPPLELPGDDDMPRVQGHEFGASERLAVAPGHEAEGYFELPGGQSGHPLSPFYRAGYEAWAQGQRTPFLPGPATHNLTLTATPAGN